MINHVRNLITPLLGACLAGRAARRTHPATDKPATPPGDTTALTVTAESALKRGDCREASESYAKAAAGGDVQLARRATQVAMACEHLPAAWQSATRWRTLAPSDREANALYAAVALKLYRTSEARGAIHEFWRVEEQKNAAAPAPAPPAADAGRRRSAAAAAQRPGAHHAQHDRADGAAARGIGRLGGADRHERRARTDGQLARHPDAARRAVARRLRRPARRPLRAAGAAARSAGPRRPAHPGARLCDARRCAAGARDRAPGEDARRAARRHASSPRCSPRWIAARRRTRNSSSCAPAARRRRRSTGAWRCWPSIPGTTRRRKQRFSELLSSGEGSDGVQLYLADIAVRDGDPDAALAGLPAPVRLVRGTAGALARRGAAARAALAHRGAGAAG